MRILVCGGRDFVDSSTLWGHLDVLHREAKHDCMVVIQGGARGADQIAREWCVSRKVAYENYPADWTVPGPIRNQQMIDRGRPDCVIAFPGGKGTADMVARACKAGLPIQLVPRD